MGVRLRRARRAQRLQQGGSVRSRRPLSQEELDLSLAAVARGREELVDVVVGEVRRQQEQRGKVQSPVGDTREDRGEPVGDTGGADRL